ncbi:MarR family winged helix-turn-helix transcriptional regulator [Alcaligenes endophyticus]|uniref:MarR family transcriptional regulator n=1 Tax=Alcaligenes endophyticus TaxID=1929088 RepID=A0ABT8EI16_9BURK|nr:MarR family transcriptional regulator [Alcaligenes endophyticus]MCX5592210.1 MarR family transcriptional regulator [Alcaligenes endophyticus]MDN4120857.1 MarR family transcriptional regulator [Alcaligenes endophyticus]
MDEFPQLQIVQQLGQTYRNMMSAFDQGLGIPLPRWRILYSLYQQGSLSQKQLVQTLRMDPAALTRQLKQIEALGLVRRAADESDNRVMNVTLTEAGHAAVVEILPRRRLFMEQMLADLSHADMLQLSRLLNSWNECIQRHEF